MGDGAGAMKVARGSVEAPINPPTLHIHPLTTAHTHPSIVPVIPAQRSIHAATARVFTNHGAADVHELVRRLNGVGMHRIGLAGGAAVEVLHGEPNAGGSDLDLYVHSREAFIDMVQALRSFDLEPAQPNSVSAPLDVIRISPVDPAAGAPWEFIDEHGLVVDSSRATSFNDMFARRADGQHGSGTPYVQAGARLCRRRGAAEDDEAKDDTFIDVIWLIKSSQRPAGERESAEQVREWVQASVGNGAGAHHGDGGLALTLYGGTFPSVSSGVDAAPMEREELALYAQEVETQKVTSTSLLAPSGDLQSARLALADAHLACGVLYQAQGKIAWALSLFMRCLAERHALLPGGHREIAGCLDVIGGCFEARGWWPAALLAYQHALAVVTASPHDHPWHAADVALALHRLLGIYRAVGDAVSANSMQLRLQSLQSREENQDVDLLCLPEQRPLLAHARTRPTPGGRATANAFWRPPDAVGSESAPAWAVPRCHTEALSTRWFDFTLCT